MKKVIAWLLVLTLTVAISIGATLAYLTDTDEDVNVMTLGKVKIDQLEYERVDEETVDEDATVQEFHDNKPLLPGVYETGFDFGTDDHYVNWDQIGKDGYTSGIWNPDEINNEVDKMVFIKNKGDYDAYVRSIFAFEAGKYTTLDEFKKMVHLNLNETDYTWEWIKTPVTIGESTYFVATATYNNILTPGALTEISLGQIALDKTATNEDVEAFGETYQILVKSQGIQADGFTDAATALNEGFGVVDSTNIPWENDNPTKGVNLKTALHYYEGGSTKITGSVANVTFGLNKDYADIVNNNSGTLVDVEQDVPARAYYVKNGATYDIYVLSDNEIYAPANSKELFANMSKLQTVKGDLDMSRVTTMVSLFDYCTSLKSVDSGNWDTGKVTSMKYMFYGCSNLTDLDVSGWDMSNVQTMNQSFYGCSKLATLDVSDWNVGNVKDFGYTFRGCSSLNGLDVSEWDVRNVTTTVCMFLNCTSLTALDVSQWETVNNTSTLQMFYGASKLKDIDVSNLDVSKVTTLKNMFYACNALTELDMSNWDVSNVTSFEGMFAACGNLKTVKVDNWKPTSAENMYALFHNCTKLESFDASGWQLPNLKTSSHMFRGCNSATFIDVSDWYTPSLTSMDAMFHTCYMLTEVDVSSFDTSKCEEMSQVFEACRNLKTIKGLENWDTGSVKTFEECFSQCGALKELDMSSFNTRNVVNSFYPMQNGSTGHAFLNMLTYMNSLEKLVIGADVSFDGDGNVTSDRMVRLPNPAAKDGFTAKWRNVETGEVYLPSEIPEETAATYEAYYEAISTN